MGGASASARFTSLAVCSLRQSMTERSGHNDVRELRTPLHALPLHVHSLADSPETDVQASPKLDSLARSSVPRRRTRDPPRF